MVSRSPDRHLFSRSDRLKQPREFNRLKQEGKRIAAGSLIANWMVRPPGSVSRLGVVTHRGVGSAVTRNRARRLMREVFRLNRHKFKQPVDLVLVARKSICGKTFFAVERDFLRALRQGAVLD